VWAAPAAPRTTNGRYCLPPSKSNGRCATGCSSSAPAVHGPIKPMERPQEFTSRCCSRHQMKQAPDRRAVGRQLVRRVCLDPLPMQGTWGLLYVVLPGDPESGSRLIYVSFIEESVVSFPRVSAPPQPEYVRNCRLTTSLAHVSSVSARWGHYTAPLQIGVHQVGTAG